MSRSRFVLPFVAVLATVALFAGACSSDTKADTTKKSTTTDKTKKQDASTTTTISDKEFGAQIDQARTTLEAAGKDPCKVMAAYETVGGSVVNPGTTTQRKQATELAIQFFDALADAAPKDLAAEAATMHKVTAQLAKEGKDTNWSAEFMKGPKAITQNKDFEQAATKVSSELGKTCTPNAGPAPQDAVPSSTTP